jgi:uncharacterized cupin superfamily protein
MRVFNVFEAEFTYDPGAPPPYAAGKHRFGPQVGGSRMGATVYELPPGTSICPYHYESEEEWLLVLAGELTVRHPEGEDVLRPGDVTAFPVGPAGAHKTTNRGTETVRLVMWANSDAMGYAAYPDSDKISYWTDSADERDGVRVRRGQKLDFYDGEV